MTSPRNRNHPVADISALNGLFRKAIRSAGIVYLLGGRARAGAGSSRRLVRVPDVFLPDLQVRRGRRDR